MVAVDGVALLAEGVDRNLDAFVQIAALSRQAAPQRGIVPAQIKVVGPVLPI